MYNGIRPLFANPITNIDCAWRWEISDNNLCQRLDSKMWPDVSKPGKSVHAQVIITHVQKILFLASVYDEHVLLVCKINML